MLETLLRTKLHLPFTRPKLVARPRLQEQIARGLRRPLTLVAAPAGFGKTTLLASFVASGGMPIAWVSLDKDDNQVERFLSYLLAALQEVDPRIGDDALQLLEASSHVSPEAVLTRLINDLDTSGQEMALALDDYQFMSNRAVHEGVAFLLEHCPPTFHLVIVTRSDPPLPLARLRARDQMVELRAADLRFTRAEAAQFLNDIMGLRLDARAVAVLEERTEGWITGLQMAALSMQDREDVVGFVEAFSGTNRFILDYLLEEILAGQSPEIQHFLLCTSILERLTAPLCDALLDDGEESNRTDDRQTADLERLAGRRSVTVLEYLEGANLFLVPLDDERAWYRYHHLFADLLRAQLQRSLSAPAVVQLHVRVADWHAENGSILEAINHASLASDDERVERFIERHYREMVSRGEMSGMRYWTGKLDKELVHRRPWLCIYAAYSLSWFGELDEADRLLDVAEQRMHSEFSVREADSMRAHLAYVKSRVTAMRGDIRRAIAFCLAARESVPADNLALQSDIDITLGYEYFLSGDYASARQILNGTIRSGITAGAVINPVAASCVMARLFAVQGLLNRSYDTYQKATQLIPEGNGQHLGVRALIEVGLADVLRERNDLDAALVHIKQGLDLLPLWDKADDLALAYVTLARIHLAQANTSDASEAIEKAKQFIQTRGVFSEARHAVESAEVRLWLTHGDLRAANRWAAFHKARLGSDGRFGSEDEQTYITLARALIAQNRANEAIDLLSDLEEVARLAGRMGRVIEIQLLTALALRQTGDLDNAAGTLTECLALAEPEGYVRVFLDESQPMQKLIAQWLARARTGARREYGDYLLAHFGAEPHAPAVGREKASSVVGLVEPLSQRELEVLHIMAHGRTNKQIACQLIVAPGTVKAHTANIYRKLDVNNRTEAVARARELGILS